MLMLMMEKTRKQFQIQTRLNSTHPGLEKQESKQAEGNYCGT
jgi:hypothetical protein